MWMWLLFVSVSLLFVYTPNLNLVLLVYFTLKTWKRNSQIIPLTHHCGVFDQAEGSEPHQASSSLKRKCSHTLYKTCSPVIESFCLFVVCSGCRVACCSEAWWWKVWRRWRFTTKMKFIRSWREDLPRGGRRPHSWTPTPGKLSSGERSRLWMISVTFTTFYVVWFVYHFPLLCLCEVAPTPSSRSPSTWRRSLWTERSWWRSANSIW